ncbi:hypothetical protein SacmaDRAFT_2753 [Saccharomonospora marina XMU15]|uniref:MmpS family membrane protein n=1 Tax=Saccharomonospora marina XMU15 TaxID=882083 RepID=H5X2Q4_9PSEU|nr:hypothetical protein [Saccharomonospora marina]EHR50993.1 hypothetical protein SacmaDRAFT_2753 [Saccharomonospora marina XMU15]
MRRAVVGTTLAALALAAVAQACGTDSPPAAPSAPPPSASAPGTSAPPPPAEGERHRVRVTVSGPYDTVLRVARGGYYTRVDLRGEPFDFSFTESEGSGYRDISVWAGTEHPEQGPVRCAIEVDGKVVAQRVADRPDGEGKASVVCEIPDPA